MELETTIGSIGTVAGVLGIFISFIIQKSEFDPTAFALSMVSIFIAIVGIALILQPHAKQGTHDRKRKSTRTKSTSPR
jgi:multisubunit Na+/H+ antiporter MnhG subunit